MQTSSVVVGPEEWKSDESRNGVRERGNFTSARSSGPNFKGSPIERFSAKEFVISRGTIFRPSIRPSPSLFYFLFFISSLLPPGARNAGRQLLARINCRVILRVIRWIISRVPLRRICRATKRHFAYNAGGRQLGMTGRSGINIDISGPFIDSFYYFPVRKWLANLGPFFSFSLISRSIDSNLPLRSLKSYFYISKINCNYS